MKHAYPRGRRLAAAAVTLVLAATGGALTALPATAAPAPAPGAAQEDQQAPVPFPRNADVVGAGPSGFLSQTRGGTPEFRWTWYADGSSIVLPGATTAAAGGTDLVVTVDRTAPVAGRVLKVYDLSTPATAAVAPQEVDLEALGDGYFFEGLAGKTLLLGRYEASGTVRQYAATLDGSTPKPRWVEGAAGIDCYNGYDGWTDTGSALYECEFTEVGLSSKVLVDFASGTRKTYVQSSDEYARPGAVSATHVAWREARMSGSRSLHGIVAHQRDKTDELWIPSDDPLEDPVYLVGSWVASGQKAHIDAPAPGGAAAGTVRPFTLQSIETGEKETVLTAFSSAVAGPGGSLLVRGGTPEHGEGLYRIAPRADGGLPDVELVASTGQSTVITLTGSSTPKTLSGEQLAGGVDFSWDLSRGDASVQVSLKHIRSGRSILTTWPAPADGADGTPGRVTWHWDGKDLERLDGVLSPARSGEYEWQFSARPEEGVGPALVTSGRFTVNRPPMPHDFDGDGGVDLFAREPGGLLRGFQTQPVAVGGSVKRATWGVIGAGWQAYDRIETAGNIAGATWPDVLARDTAGTLWLYQGNGDRAQPLSGRTRIGGGWQVYDRIAAGSDVTGDGRPDLLATDKSGVLWLYAGTGNANVPFSAAKRVGGGWGVYNELSAVGNFAGGPAGDLLARDKDGVLWLYLGKGDGTFAARSRVGGGWGGFLNLVGVGDANGDGRADLMVSTTPTPSAWGVSFYAGTGDWKAPLKAGVKTDATSWARYDAVF
ncbi:VCBS repeat-containing protein [Streptomyces sp. NBC_00572]|uniref:VCBS repeat-containing protein n=1 Tax=Streptomyces sp. NBC_00572 TaxID=2903664 RepID=UPI00224E7654|nr:VCBS repeat-containing protein [Streptomyces sp. NBC_00572]MCX4981362.1 VCBS repeat-containing protein [Streptomyces sp. NBC_00572]